MSNYDSQPIPPEVRADLQTVIDHLTSGRPLDDELVRRVIERSRRAQEELVWKDGIREIAVELIRERRGEQ